MGCIDISYISMQHITQICINGGSFDTIQAHIMLRCCKRAFVLACEHQHLDQIIWLYDKYPDSIACIDKASIFNDMCKKGNIEIAQWFAETFDLYPNRNTFNVVCINDDLEMAQWLVNKYACIEPSLTDFLDVCIGDYTTFAQWLYDISPAIRDADIAGENFEYDTCSRRGKIRADRNDQSLFAILCEHNCLETAKWIYTIAPNSVITDESLLWLCRHDRLEAIQCLLDIIAYTNGEICGAFLEACNKNSQNVTHYLEKYTESMEASCHSFGKYGYIMSKSRIDGMLVLAPFHTFNGLYIYTTCDIDKHDVECDVKQRHSQKRIKSATK